MAERQAILDKDSNYKRYLAPIDPLSAHEVLLQRTAARTKQAQEVHVSEKEAPAANKPKPRVSNRESAGEAFLKSVARAAGSSLGRKLFRGVLGSLLK